MTQRTQSPPSASYLVCRTCRMVSDGDPWPAPFCSALCAAEWAIIRCDPTKFGSFICTEPPLAGRSPHWKLLEGHALAMEVH